MVSTPPTTTQTSTEAAAAAAGASTVAAAAIKAVVCDIEGTTTSISFVKDVLFVYALANVDAFLDQSWEDVATKEAVELLRTESTADVAAGTEGAVAIAAADADKAAQIASLVDSVKWQMSIDRKAKPLKTLQGLIWSKAYLDGSVKGQVYEDVPKAFDAWTSADVKVYIYSSGSVAAQKLLFGHSEAGDLLPKLSGHFDTEVGPKQQSESYAAIVKQLGLNANEVLFLTDVVAEAKAAKTADLQVIVLDRPGNAPLTDAERSEYKVVSSFADISLTDEVVASIKRKLEDEEEVATEQEVRPSKIAKTEETTLVPVDVPTPAADVAMDEPTSSELTTKNGDVPGTAVVAPTPEAVVESTTSTDNAAKTNGTATGVTEEISSSADVDMETDAVAEPVVAIETPINEANASVPDVPLSGEPKTDIDAGNEPTIVEATMDVDMAETATTVSKAAVSADETDKAKTDSAEVDIPKADAETGKAELETVAIVAGDEVKAEVVVDEKVTVDEVEKMDEEVKTVEVVKEAVETKIDNDVAKPSEVDSESKTVKDSAENDGDVVDKVATEEPAKLADTTDNTKNVAVTENTKEAVASEKPPVAAVEPTVVPVENKTDISASSTETIAPVATEAKSNQTVPPEETKTNEVNIPITVVSEPASTTETSASPSSALTTSSSETSEVTEITDKDKAGKEKVSRVEITIEQIDKQAGQTTQTTTHIVKEITIKEQLVVSPKKGNTTEPTAVVPTNEVEIKVVAINGTNGSESLENTNLNGKAAPASEKIEDDSDKENEVSTTNGGASDVEPTPEVLKKSAIDSLNTAEPVSEATA